jgi:hypothetical protein
MKVLEALELEQLVRKTFPGKQLFSAMSELGLSAGRPPVVAFVHGGPDPFLDSQFDAWLEGSPTFVTPYQLLNRLCRAGAIAPGDYALTKRH